MDGVPGYSTVQPCGWMIMCPKDTHNFWAVQMDDDVPKNIHNFGQYGWMVYPDAVLYSHVDG
jgi:hypothetical protein